MEPEAYTAEELEGIREWAAGPASVQKYPDMTHKRLLATIDELEGMIDEAEDNGWCFDCQDYAGITSHYHCANCGAADVGMFGHSKPDGGFTCTPTSGQDGGTKGV